MTASNIHRPWRVTLAGLALLAAWGPLPRTARAQQSQATLLGRVTDPSGAVLANVTVEALNKATGVRVTATTNPEGSYRIPYLIAGEYQVTFTAAGFQRLVRQNVILRVADIVTLDGSLELGAVSQEVTVAATNPPLETATASLGQVVDHQRLEETPFREGNPHEFIKLAPGIITTTHLRLDKPGMSGGLSQVSSDGSNQYRSEYQIDGVANTNGNNVAYSPPAAAVQEMKVETATYDASLGYTGGGTFNLVSRGGTNQYHGEGSFFYRNGRFDWKDFFADRNNQPKPQYTDSRYDAAFGGPIKRDKLFFFVATEFNPYQNPFSFQMSVPTPQERTGDLTQLNYQGTVYDPLSGRPDPSNPNRVLRDPFPTGNLLPPSRLNSASLKLINLYPLPNLPGVGQNFQHPDPVEFHDWNTGSVRVDYAISARHRAFVRYAEARWAYHDPYVFLSAATSPGDTTDRTLRLGAVDDTYTFSPSLVLNSRFGWTFSRDLEAPASTGIDLAKYDLGGLAKLSSSPKNLVLPSIQISGYTGYLRSIGASDSYNDDHKIYSIAETFNYMRASHMFSFGGEFRRYWENFFDDFNSRTPTFTFTSGWTNGPYNTSPSVNQLHALAGFLLGYPNGGSMAVAAPRDESTTESGFFIQDNWRVLPRLTLNLGLRWELETPTTEAQNRTVNGLDLTTALPIQEAVLANYAQNPVPGIAASDFHVRGGLLYAGVGRQPSALWQTRWHNLMPRLGFAYQIDGKTVLRGGYGRFYDQLGINRMHSIQTGYSQGTGVQTTKDGILPVPDAFTNPFPNGLLQPVGNTLGPMENVGNSIGIPYADGVQTPYADRFSITVQRQLPWGFVVEDSYIANRGDDLPVLKQLDAVPIQYLSAKPTRDQAAIDFLSAQFPNPFFGVLSTGTSLGSSSRLARSQFLYAYPQFTGVSYTDSIGRSWYDANQLRVERRMAGGATVSLSYSFSKTLQQTTFRSNSEPNPDKQLSDFDRNHVLQVNGIWSLPFGRGRHWGSNWGRPVNHILGDWQISMMYRMESGYPVGFGDPILNPGNTFASLAIPSSQRTWQHEFNTTAVDKVPGDQRAWGLPLYSAKVGTVRTEGFDIFDAVLMKNINFTERLRLQLRAECYNMLNSANLLGLITDFNSPAYGSVTGVNGYARQMQFGFRVFF